MYQKLHTVDFVFFVHVHKIVYIHLTTSLYVYERIHEHPLWSALSIATHVGCVESQYM